MCSSEVSDTDDLLQRTFGQTPGLNLYWVFTGPSHRARAWVDELGIDLPVIVDEGGTFQAGWFVGQGDGAAWAGNPRHYVLDAEGVLRYASTTPIPGELVEAIEATLAR